MDSKQKQFHRNWNKKYFKKHPNMNKIDVQRSEAKHFIKYDANEKDLKEISKKLSKM